MTILDLPSAAYPAAILVSVTSLILVLSHNWRWSILTLALQYVGVFLLTTLSWSIEMSVAKLVAGWMASAVLGIAISEAAAASPVSWRESERAWPSSRLFRLLAACLVLITVISGSNRISEWVPGLELPQTIGGMMLIGMGLLHLGLTAQPLRVVLGLLTVLSGFEIFYAVVEASTLVAGLLAAVTLGLALAGAYLLLSPIGEEST